MDGEGSACTPVLLFSSFISLEILVTGLYYNNTTASHCMYSIAGNFDEVYNLANFSKVAKFKITDLNLAHARL